jgi:hypothetical protein
MNTALTKIKILAASTDGHIHAIIDPRHDHRENDFTGIEVLENRGHVHKVIDNGHSHPFDDEDAVAYTRIALEAGADGHTHEIEDFGHRHVEDVLPLPDHSHEIIR